jgi:hypothetical protein
MKTKDKGCVDCFYSRVSLDGRDLLECRRHGPNGGSVRAYRLGAGLSWIAVWPVVRDNDWCGDFAIFDAVDRGDQK